MTEDLSAQEPSAQAVKASALPQLDSHTTLQQASAMASSGLESAALFSQAALPEPDGLHIDAGVHIGLHQCQPGTTMAAGTTVATQCEGFAQQSRQGFWQELQGVLNQLPDHRAPVGSVAEANQCRGDEAGNVPGNVQVLQTQSHSIVSVHAAVCQTLQSVHTSVYAANAGSSARRFAPQYASKPCKT